MEKPQRFDYKMKKITKKNRKKNQSGKLKDK